MAILPIEVKESGITQTNRKIKELDKSADKLTGTFSGVTAGAMRLAGGIAALVGIGQLTRSFIQNADAMTNMNSQLKLVTKSTSELLKVQNQLFNISQSSRTSLQGTTELYAKIARNTKDLNVSNKELLKVTETISKAMTISGGSAESMNAAIVQLSQGFASGTLRGEELNSVMEQTPRLAEAIAEGMGKSLGELRALGAEGKLTAQAVMEALKSQAETIDTEFKNVGTTVSQSMTQVSNSTLMLVGDMDKAFGVTNQLSSSLTELSKVLIDNKDDIIDVGQDIIAGATIVANGLESIYLVSKIGYMKLGVAFKSEIEAVLNAIIEAFESSLNYITKEINQSTDYWNKALGLDIGTISEVSLGRVTIDTNDLSKSIEDANSRIQELGKSTDAAFIEIAMGAEQVVVAVDMVSKKTSEIKATSLLGTKEDRELAIEQSQQLADLIIKALDYIKSDTDKINEKNLEMYNVMQSIWDDTEMQKFFKKWQKEIDDVTKKSDKYDGIGSKDWTAGLKGQAKDIANIGNAFSDLGKEQKEWAKYSKENATSEEDKATHLDNQLGLYGNIAGAISNMAAEGSAAAKVAQVAQAALAIVQGASAILSQGTGDPYTAIPRMIAMAATVAQVLGNAGIGGGGGGAISGATIQESQFNSAITELTMQPMLDRLDRQIELLEIIGLEGTAGRARLSQADLQYRMDTKLLAEEIIRGTQTLVVQEGVGQASGVLADWNNRFVEINKTVGDSLFTLDEANKAIYFNAQVFRENTLGSLSAIYENELLNVLANWEEAQKEGARTWEQFNAFATATGTNTINELQGITHDYIMTLGDVVESMADAKDNFKDIYDELTGLNAYAERDLKEAFNRVSSLVSNSGSESFAQYLSKQVEAIEKVQSRFNTDITELFLSTNPDDLQKQADALKELNLVMDNAFGDGVQSALDYLDAIDLVSEAMITSKDNLETLSMSFMDAQQQAEYLARKVGVQLATTWNEFGTLTTKLTSDLDGLTDKELELLEANKDLIESGLDEYLNTVTDNISSLESSLTSLSNILNKFGEVFGGTDYSLNKFYDSMENTQALLASGDFNEYNKSLAETIRASEILFKPEAFSSAEDMLLVQARAANQFENLEDATLEQIDYLQLIEENTRNQIDAILLLVSALGQKIDESLSKTSPTNNLSSGNSVIDAAYQSILGRTPDVSGISTWTGEIAAGNLTSATVTQAIGVSSLPEIYATLLGRTPDAGGLATWTTALESGAVAPENLVSMMRQSAIANGEVPLFAKGGFTGIGNGIIDATGQKVAGVVHEEEWVAPKWMIQNNQNLFNQLENARQRGSFANGGFTSDTMVQGNNSGVSELQESMVKLEKMFRDVTENGSTMNVRLVG